MKKSLIAACAALVCASGAYAQSSVTLTGLVDMYAASQKQPGTDGRVNQLGSGGMTTSWFGMTGTEDLGGGLKANFKLTSFQRLDTGTPGRFGGDNFFTRDANVGLSGGFGAVTLGRGLAPNFLPTILFNPFGDSFQFAPLVLQKNVGLFNPGAGYASSTPSDTGWSNEIIYTTPTFGGLTVNVHYQFGEQNSSTNNDNKKNLGINAIYFNGPFALTGYYEHDQVNNYNGNTGANAPMTLITAAIGGANVPTTRKDWMLGGSYDAGIVKGFLTYGQTKTDITDVKYSTTQVGASAPIGAGKLLASVARTSIDNAPTFVNKRLTATIGYDYFLSKRTDVYANLMYDRLTSELSKGNTVAVGIRHRF
ncbi:porin [Xylophilus sp. GOD-11R]|uniref:porin n=1 Tax=Xylophilus sp. GOD-11R TaxID=3089814 RepID=UPI00298D0ABD|nr:porin [Xylophilus sp. GOD-11R]WPB56340.1 porin [Xylophilus sp. GOD-11R]